MTAYSENGFMPRPPSNSTTITELSSIEKAQEKGEGDRQGWLTVIGSLLVYYSSYGLVNSFGFFQDFYHDDFLVATPASTIAFIGTLQIALVNCLATVSGALCDSYGVKYLYIIAGVGTCGSLTTMSFFPPGATWQVFLTQGLLMGIAVAVGCQPALTVAGQHFNKKRALAMGIVTTGCGLGGTLYPIMFHKLMPVIGFSWVIRIAALKTSLCYSIALCISTSKHTRRPMKEGLKTLLDFRGFLDMRYTVLCLGAFVSQFGIWIPNYYIEQYYSIIDPVHHIKGYVLPLINGSSVLGMITGGLLGDRIGRLNTQCPITILLGLSTLTLWMVAKSVHTLIIFAIIFGFLSGIYVAVLPPIVSQISPDENMGARMGAFYSIIAVASLTGAPIAGTLIRGNGKDKEDYTGVIGCAGGMLILGGIIFCVARWLHGGRTGWRW